MVPRTIPYHKVHWSMGDGQQPESTSWPAIGEYRRSALFSFREWPILTLSKSTLFDADSNHRTKDSTLDRKSRPWYLKAENDGHTRLVYWIMSQQRYNEHSVSQEGTCSEQRVDREILAEGGSFTLMHLTISRINLLIQQSRNPKGTEIVLFWSCLVTPPSSLVWWATFIDNPSVRQILNDNSRSILCCGYVVLISFFRGGCDDHEGASTLWGCLFLAGFLAVIPVVHTYHIAKSF